MIKAAILDIDGVLLGHTEGVNFPLPSPAVQERLRNLSKLIPISLCTVKAPFAMKPIVDTCLLYNNHIVDAGASIMNGATGSVTMTEMDSTTVKIILEKLKRTAIYTEWYTNDTYYTFENGEQIIRAGRTTLLGKEATLAPEYNNLPVGKIITLPMNEDQANTVTDIANGHRNEASLHWGQNPSLIPKMAAFFTHPSATKRTGAMKISELTGIALKDTLAIGDSANDWTFMELCGYAATLGNGSPELKELLKTKKTHGYVTDKTIDEDGLVAILDYFSKQITK